MLPGRPQLIKCPSCGMYQQRGTLLSGNTFGAVFYTDGKCIAPMLPEFPRFIRCPKCKAFFVINDSLIQEQEQDNTNIDEISYVQFLEIDEYHQAIRAGLYNGGEDDVLSLRISLWRAYNDIVRNGNDIADKSLYEDNCKKILAELCKGTSEDENRLMCAELWRNIGSFDKCRKLLGEISQPDKYKNVISAINTACDTQNTSTVVF